MKIIASYSPLNHKTCGLTAALQVLNSDTLFWTPQQKNIQDMVYEQKPDALFIHQEFLQNITLDELSNKVKCIYVMTENHIEIYRYGKSIKKPVFNIAANSAQYTNGVFDPLLASDILYISNQVVSDEDLVLLKALDNSHYRFKAVGIARLPLLSYIGNASIRDISHLIASASMLLDINGNCDNDATYNSKPFVQNNSDHTLVAKNIEDVLNNETPTGYIVPDTYLDFARELLLEVILYDI
jgi:hypothetical protein